MLKVYCDMCGTPIDHKINGVNLDINCFGTVKFNTNWDCEKQLCTDCATKVVRFIDNKFANRSDNNAE